jgi:hypothetical protein
MAQQGNWQFCLKCDGLFYAGNSLGVCPAGGTHDPSESSGYALTDSPPGESDWRFCSKCQGLFFAGNNNLGVCPTHSDADSGTYFLPQSGNGQPSWKFCSKCQGLFFAGNNNLGVCAAGGTHDDGLSGNYFLPQSGNGQAGWKFCSKCQGMFFAGNNSLGSCPAGGTHEDSLSGNYFLPQSGNGQAGWRFCNQCQGLFFAGNNLGVCPAPGPHTDTGSDNYVLSQSGGGQPGWQFCNRCQGLFFGGDRSVQLLPNAGVCPSRVSQPGHQVGTTFAHDGSTSGDYILTQLGSGTNYILSSNGNNLLGVSVTINIKKEIVYASDSGADAGFAFQLNAYSANSQSIVGWQQYVIIVGWENVFKAQVNNWPPGGGNQALIDIINVLAPMESPKIPEDYSLTITLENDMDGNVIGATYLIVDNSGTELVPLPNQEVLLTPPGQPALPVAPIVAFQLDIVGPINSESAVLSSGAGTITYSASNALLTATNQVPPGAVGKSTGESANTFYGVLPANPGTKFIQSFNITP